MKTSHGFTLFETIIAVIIMGILMAIAAPNVIEMIRSQRVRDATFDLQASVMRARSEAMKRNTAVTILPVGGSWTNGWSIANPAYAGKYIEEHAAPSDIVITPYCSATTSIAFNSLGRMEATQQAKLDIYSSGAGVRRCLIIELTGRPNVKSAGCTTTCT